MKINVPLVTNAAKAVRHELEVLSKSALESEVATINNVLPTPHWKVVGDNSETRLEASYKLRNYLKTWEFLNVVAANAHSLRHHPTIITTYNKIEIKLTTHDAGNQITYLDTKLATAIHNAYAADFAKKTVSSDVGSSTFTMNRAFRIIDELTKREIPQKENQL